MVEMGMGNKNTQQSWISTVQPFDIGKILASVFVGIQRQPQINEDPLASAFDLYATAADLFAAAMDTCPHDFSTLLLNLVFYPK